MADTPDLGSGAFGVQVQVLSSAPTLHNTLLELVLRATLVRKDSRRVLLRFKNGVEQVLGERSHLRKDSEIGVFAFCCAERFQEGIITLQEWRRTGPR